MEGVEATKCPGSCQALSPTQQQAVSSAGAGPAGLGPLLLLLHCQGTLWPRLMLSCLGSSSGWGRIHHRTRRQFLGCSSADRGQLEQRTEKGQAELWLCPFAPSTPTPTPTPTAKPGRGGFPRQWTSSPLASHPAPPLTPFPPVHGGQLLPQGTAQQERGLRALVGVAGGVGGGGGLLRAAGSR